MSQSLEPKALAPPAPEDATSTADSKPNPTTAPPDSAPAPAPASSPSLPTTEAFAAEEGDVSLAEAPPAPAAPAATAAASAPPITPPKHLELDTARASTSLELDTSKPEDFEGEVITNDDLPSPETIKEIENYVVLDRNGKTHTFKSLYSGRNIARRVLVIFIRHFFCGVSYCA
jgi:hypothetical protein